MAKRIGRPRVLADAAPRAQLYQLLEAGISREDAASQLGFSRDTIAREAKRDKDFAAGLVEAEAKGKNGLILILQQAADRDWRAAAWMLERKWWREWAKRSPDQVSPDQLASVIGRVVATILAEVPAQYRGKVQAKINDILGSLTGLGG